MIPRTADYFQFLSTKLNFKPYICTVYSELYGTNKFVSYGENKGKLNE